MVVSLWASSSSSLGPPFILSSSSSLSSSSFITSLFVWKKEGQRVVVVVWSAKQKHLEYRCAFRARARPTGIITTREKCQKRGREKMVKKKRDFFFKFFHLGF